MSLRVHRRSFVMGTSSLALTALTAQSSAAQTPAAINRGPSARVEPFTETFFGEAITDNYRWMETPNDPDWEAYMRANAEHANILLEALPGRTAMLNRMGELTGASSVILSVQPVGSKLFFVRRDPGRQTGALLMREGASEKVLVDPEQMRAGAVHVSLDWWAPSPNGAFVVYGLSSAGSESSVTHIMNVATGEILPERIDRTQYAFPSWLPDSSGFMYNRLQVAAPGSADYYRDSVCWLHKLRTDPAADIKILARNQYPQIAAEPTDFPVVVATTGSSSVIAILIGGVRRENPIWTAKLSDLLAGRPLWRQVCSVADQVVGSALINDTLYLQTTKDAENGKIVMTSASRPSLASAKTIVPESDVVIQEITVAKDALYVMDMDGGYSRLRRRAHGEGVPVSTLAMPFEGAGSFLGSDVDKDGVLLRFASWLESPKIYEVKGASATITDTGLQPTSPINTVAYEAIRTFVTARDNTKVPLSIIRKKGAPKDGTSPTLVQAYGAYQISSPPGFWARGFAFLEAGGTLVTAHVRGGGEYGRRWWKAGKQLTKPNTWRDVIDCCDYLVKEGYTSAGKLAMSGTSAGGIAAGRVLTERPDLFCAVIPRVGVLNALRMEFTQNGPPNIAEFGTVKEADGFKGLREMDSLFHVRDGTRYPAVLLTHGMTDPRVEPWNSAKMVARLRAADPVGGPFLLRVTFDAGHGLGSTRTQVDTEWTDIFSFILSRAKASA